MSIKKAKKSTITNYMMEQIEMGESVVVKTKECFALSEATIYKYLEELLRNNKITRVKRGKYKLVMSRNVFTLENKSLSEDMIFDQIVAPNIAELGNEVKKIWSYGFTEMMNNAIEHSESDKIKCVIVKNEISVMIVIIDEGVGIFEKIRKYYGYNSPEDAIIELFKGKLTTDASNHTGEGIYFTSRIMDWFCIISAEKIFSHDNCTESVSDIETLDLDGINKAGTHVFMKLANNSKKKLREVFDEFADEDEGGFNKTMIQIKNIFGNKFPVSRSQARRLCNRFEKFKEIILDFDDVEEIGQGFADELFSKFEMKNSNIIITIINANKEVNKMINHARNTIR